MIKYRKQTWMVISLLCILLFFCGLFLYHKNEMKTSCDINERELLDNIECMKQRDGGFCEINIINSSTLYTYLFDTYNAIYICDKLDIDIPEKYLKDLVETMREMTIEDIIVTGLYDDVNRTLYYLKIMDMLNIDIDQGLENTLLTHIKNLQSDEGFFYNSTKEKNEYDNYLKQYKENDPIILATMTNAIDIIKGKNLDINKESLIQWIQRSLSVLSYDDTINDMSIATIDTIIKAINELNLDIDIIDLDNINKLYQKYYEKFESTAIDTLYLCELYEIG